MQYIIYPFAWLPGPEPCLKLRVLRNKLGIYLVKR